MKKTLFLLSLLLFGALPALAQQRYLQPVFDQVGVQAITYGSNFSIMPIIVMGSGAHSVRQFLKAHVYTPIGDVERKRPLVIYLKTGNLFPFPQNNACGGALNDSSNVEVATRLAKMGYVVAVADYRGGWSPISDNQVTRRFSFINALYRGVQDVNTCVRYFRKDVAEYGNQFGIDPEKIVVWGQGTGGYLSLAAAYLNKFEDIYNTSDPNKFIIINPQFPGGKYNMVQEDTNGNPYATTGPTMVDALLNTASSGLLPVGDTLCVSNHVGYPSNFQLCVNMGGALADSNWLDWGDIPLISYHVPSDPFAPCGTGDIGFIAPPFSSPILDVTGSCDLHYYVEKFGNNDVFKKILPSFDPLAPIAKSRNSGANGFFPFIGTPNKTAAPWEWTSYAGTPPPNLGTNCNVNAAVARTYIDTITRYFAPRGCVALGLDCGGVSSIGNWPIAQAEMTIVPNPATVEVTLAVPEGLQCQNLQLFDTNGRLVRIIQPLGGSTYTLYRAGLPSGVYFVKAYFEKGVLAQKLVFE